MSSSQNSVRNYCEVYQTFGYCAYGEKCKKSHEGIVVEQKYFCAKIESTREFKKGCIAAVTMKNDNSVIQKYYIVNHEWHHAEASINDSVLFQSSSNKYEAWPFGRIIGIFPEKRGDTVNLAPKNCEVYQTFGSCAYGGKCKKSHEGIIAEQKYFGAKIVSIAKFENGSIAIVKMKNSASQGYYITEGIWHGAEAKVNDFVLFQSSSKKYKGWSFGWPFGRIVGILPEFVPNNFKIIEKHVRVYTVDPIGTHRYDDAFSVEKCTESGHKACTKIGIYITALALEDLTKVRCTSIPLSYSNQTHQTKISWSMNKDDAVIAVAIYAHSSKKPDLSPTGPHIVVAKVVDNITISDWQTKEKNFDVLWKAFTDSTENWPADEQSHVYCNRYPRTWKERYIISKMMEKFHSTVVKSVSPPLLIMKAEKANEAGASQSDSVVVYSDELDNVKLDKVSSLWPIVACETRFTNVQAPRETCLQNKYSRDVGPPDHTLTRSLCTSPLRDFSQLLNHQMLIHRFLGYINTLYEREELLGLLNIRFRTPKLVAAVVHSMEKDRFVLEYPEFQGVPKSLCALDFSNFPSFTEASNNGMEQRIFTFKNMVCAQSEYKNRNLIIFKREEFSKCFANAANADRVIDDALKYLKLEQPTVSPYQVAGCDTTFSLQIGVQLELQISARDAQDNNDCGMRLLNIGKNCHMCLHHIIHPKKAFISDRDDVQTLMTSTTEASGKLLLETFLVASTEEKIKTKTLCDITINWTNNYFSGGSFTTNQKVKKGELLCIRSEVCDESNKVKYVWCCHAVVADYKEKKVEFSVCTMSQKEEAPDKKDCFCIEIITFSQMSA